MAKAKTYPELSETYRTAWESSVALWPLFILRFIYLFLNIAAFIICLCIGFWPLIQGLWSGFTESGMESFEGFAKSFNWASYFTDFHWIVIAVGLFVLFATWWTLIASLFNGG